MRSVRLTKHFSQIVVFRVGGLITITERVVIQPRIYIAGQTAPGQGITVSRLLKSHDG